MQNNCTQAAEHARDQRGKGQPQQEAKRKRTGTRRILRAIRGRIRGRTSMRRHRKKGFLCVACCVLLKASCPAQTAAVEVAFILRLRFWRLRGGPQGEKRGGTLGPGTWRGRYMGAQSEAATQKARMKHEPGHMPVAAPAMLEGYASMRPPRTAHRASAGRRHHIRKDQR